MAVRDDPINRAINLLNSKASYRLLRHKHLIGIRAGVNVRLDRAAIEKWLNERDLPANDSVRGSLPGPQTQPDFKERHGELYAILKEVQTLRLKATQIQARLADLIADTHRHCARWRELCLRALRNAHAVNESAARIPASARREQTTPEHRCR